MAKRGRRENGLHRREKQRLGIVVRNASTGQLDPKLVRAAELEVQRLHARLITGTLPQTPAERAAANLPALPTADTLTLREGFSLALDPKRGKYASTETRRYDDMVLYEARLFGLKPGTRPLINPQLVEEGYTFATSERSGARWRMLTSGPMVASSVSVSPNRSWTPSSASRRGCARNRTSRQTSRVRWTLGVSGFAMSGRSGPMSIHIVLTVLGTPWTSSTGSSPL